MKQKRQSGTNAASDQLKILKTAQTLGMDSKVVEKLYATFERNSGKLFQISFNLAIDIFRRQQGIFLSRQQLEENFDTKTNALEFTEFCRIFSVARKLQDQADNEQMEIVNSFVALGGQSDKTGVIKKSVIINIVKNQFQLTFDIEQLLDRNGETDNLDYDSFSRMFAKVQESQRDIMRASFSNAIPIRGKKENDELNIKYQDFENWFLLNGA